MVAAKIALAIADDVEAAKYAAESATDVAFAADDVDAVEVVDTVDAVDAVEAVEAVEAAGVADASVALRAMSILDRPPTRVAPSFACIPCALLILIFFWLFELQEANEIRTL